MTQKELKQLSQDLIDGKGREKLSKLTKEEESQLLGIMQERFRNSVVALQETLQEAKDVLKETRGEIARARTAIARNQFNNTFPTMGEA
jgi:replicative DNA helicase